MVFSLADWEKWIAVPENGRDCVEIDDAKVVVG